MNIDTSVSPSTQTSNNAFVKRSPQMMTSILLPTREGTNNMKAKIGREGYKKPQLRWVGMTPLEWIDSIQYQVTIGKTKTTTEEERKTSLSSSATNSPFVKCPPRMVATKMDGKSKVPPTSSAMLMEESSSNENLVSKDSASPSSTQSTSGKDVATSSVHQPSSLIPFTNIPKQNPHHVTTSPLVMPTYWEMSYLQPTPLTERVRVLAVQVESHPLFSQVQLTYSRTHNHFNYSVWYVRTNFRYPTETERQMNMLYYETIHKLDAIVKLEQKLWTAEQEYQKFHQPVQHQQQQREEGRHRHLDTIGLDRSPQSSSKSRKSSSKTRSITTQHLSGGGLSVSFVEPPLPKVNVNEYLVHWLRQNWVNPYPCNQVLDALAQDCGTSPHTMNIWLTNARSRYWRPAMKRALELGRPSEYLLEDSINIFDGKAIRNLDFHHHQRHE